MIFLYYDLKTKPISSWFVALTAETGDLLCYHYNYAMFV